MKNRKNVVVALLLVAVLCMGIGFAALSDELTIGGTVSVGTSGASTAWDNAVKFIATTALTGTHTGTAHTPAISDNGDTITATIDNTWLKVKGDTVSFTATVINSHTEYDALIKSLTASITGDNTEYFKIAVSGLADNDVVTANESKVFTVTITLEKTPVTEISGTISICFTAESQAKSN